MKSNKLLVLIAAIFLGCSNNSKISGAFPSTFSGLTNGPVLPVVTGANVLPLTVNGSLCSAANSNGYQNKPCVSITICSTTNANCQTIDDVLVDTGSYGLRIFKSVLNANIALTPVTSGGKTVADCQQYGVGDGTADWGSVQLANVTLASEPSVQMPIEIIDATLGGSSNCTSDETGDTFTLHTTPVQTGYNAIMGVGLFGADCGEYCANNSNNGQYFTCSGNSCTGITMASANQVTNPMTLLPVDNNGVIVELPSISLGGVVSTNGYLILGIGTESNNTPQGVTAYNTTSTDQFGDFTTTFNGEQSIGFIDSGTNVYLFDKPASLPDCTGNETGYYCPASVTTLEAIDSANSGGAQTAVNFYIGNTTSLLSGNNMVFMELGADDDGSGVFDWGLPFFLGRNVYVGQDGKSSPLGTGPYWAF